jgi:hypothetical protein
VLKIAWLRWRFMGLALRSLIELLSVGARRAASKGVLCKLVG